VAFQDGDLFGRGGELFKNLIENYYRIAGNPVFADSIIREMGGFYQFVCRIGH
jgi:hypothetical protein